MLRERHVDEIHRLFERLPVFDCLRDADDFQKLTRAAPIRRAVSGAVVDAEMLTDGAGVRPVMPGELFVDDCHARRRGRVGPREGAPLKNLHAHRGKKSFIDRVERRREALAIARHRIAVGDERDPVEGTEPERRILREPRALDSGLAADAIGEPCVELQCLVGAVLHEPRIEPRHQHAVAHRGRTGVDADAEAAQHQERRRQQHQRQRDLGDDERAPPPQPAAAVRVHVRGLQPVDQFCARRLQSGREAAHDCAGDRQRQARDQHASVQSERQHDRQLARNRERVEEADARVGDGDAADAACGREDQAFRQQHPDQPGASGADREADGDFAGARLAAAQQQSGDVRARDREHRQRQHGEDDDELPLAGLVPCLDLEVRADRRAAIAIQDRIIPSEIPGDDRDLASRLLQRDAGFQPCAHEQLAMAAVLEERLLVTGRERGHHRERHVEIGPLKEQQSGKRFRRHADDRKVRPVQTHRPSDD